MLIQNTLGLIYHRDSNIHSVNLYIKLWVCLVIHCKDLLGKGTCMFYEHENWGERPLALTYSILFPDWCIVQFNFAFLLRGSLIPAFCFWEVCSYFFSVLPLYETEKDSKVLWPSFIRAVRGNQLSCG